MLYSIKEIFLTLQGEGHNSGKTAVFCRFSGCNLWNGNEKDRKKAIIYASEILSHKECLVILGKGHEETQEENNKTIFFSDHEVINEIYK